MDARAKVLIVGAGPTGLVLALLLTRLGVPVRIIDRALASGTTSRALAVQARTLEFYGQLGIADAVIEAGVTIDTLNLWVRGQQRAKVSLAGLGEGQTPYPFALVYPQDAHEALLEGELRQSGVLVERGVELRSFRQHDDFVEAHVVADGEPQRIECQYLIGCDGGSSTVREEMGAGFPGGTYEGLFYVADVVASGIPSDHELNIDIEDTDFMLVFPMKEPGGLRLVGLASTDASANAISGQAAKSMGLQVSEVRWFSTYRVHHRVADRFRDRRVFLAGDAGHIHSPVGGQGMNTGIGDAVNLGWKLAQVLSGGADLLDTYEPERKRFAETLVATTDRAFTLVTRRGWFAKWVRRWLVPVLAPRLFRVPFLRSRIFRTISQTGVHYRDLALSVGEAGVRSGDRLPWVPNEASDNFNPLQSWGWQAHVYGDPDADLASTCESLSIPLHVFPFSERASRAGLAQGALYLVRPDGYIGLAARSGQCSATLRSYWSAAAGTVHPPLQER